MLKKPKLVLYLSIVCIVLIIATFTTILLHPQVVINDFVVDKALIYFKDIKVANYHIDVKSTAWNVKTLKISAESICYKKLFCTSFFSGDFSFSLTKQPYITINSVLGEHIHVEVLTSDDTAKNTDSDSAFNKKWLQWVSINNVDLDIHKIKAANVEVKGKIKIPSLDYNANTQQVDIDLQIKQDANIHNIAILGRLHKQKDFNLQINYSLSELTANATIKGVWQNDSIKMSASINAKNVIDNLHIGIKKCDFVIDNILNKKVSLAIDTTCKSHIDYKYEHLSIALPFTLKSEVVLTKPINIGTLTVKNNIVFSNFNLAKTQGKVVNLLEYDLDKKEFKYFDISAKVDSEVISFASLVKELQGSAWEVPAPFASYDGKLKCHVEGTYFFISDKSIDLSCSIDIYADKYNVLNSSVLGSIVLAGDYPNLIPKIDADIMINALRVQVPDFNFTEDIPAFFASKDVEKKSLDAKKQLAPKDKPTPIFSNIRLHSKEGEVQVYSKLLKKPLLFDINVGIVDGATYGSVVLKKYEVELFKRQAIVQHFELTVNASRSYPINALIVFPDREYSITMNVAGMASKPIIYFESSPPLGQNEIYSILLFGKKQEFLDQDQLKSTSEVQAAVVDKALNLLSMYYLASTPVESISYNPLTAIVEVKVKLGDKTSVILGSDIYGESYQSLGVRQRLAKDWTIETTTKTKDNAVRHSALLRWGLRY